MAKHSYSAIKAYENCPRQFHEVKILKKYPREETEATIYGTQLHEQAELFIRDGRPLDEGFKFLQPVLDSLNAMPGRKFCEHEMGVTERLEPCGFHDENYWSRGIADLLIVDDDNLTARCFDYKGLPLNTEIPVPGGFVTMENLRVGDTVFGADGQPCRVTHKSSVHHKPCLELIFDDGARIICDEDHKWVLSTGEVTEARNLSVGEHMPVAKPVSGLDVRLPVDPYVLGLWLADGKHTSGEITKPDSFVWSEIERRGYQLGVDQSRNSGKCTARTVLGLLPQLRCAGVLGNKHIPAVFMHASYAQRLDLLRGIMDGDGYANPTRQQAVMNSPNYRFAVQVKELAASLGNRVYMAETQARGFGKQFTAYPIQWRPTYDVPFSMPRKAAVFKAPAARSFKRRIREINRVDTVPTQCIGVDSVDHTYLCTRDYLVTHNSGSNKYPDTDQLMLMSLLTFAHFPHIRKVSSGLLFVLKGTSVKHTVYREQEAELWWAWRERVARLDASTYHGVWNPKQSGLCRRHCPVEDCSFNGRNA